MNDPLNPPFGLVPPPSASDIEMQLRQVREDLLALTRTFQLIAPGVVQLTSTGVPTGASPVSVPFEHNLGYKPGMFAYVEFGGFRFPFPYTLYNITTGAIRNRIYSQSDEDQVLFIYQDWETTGETHTYDVRFYLTREPAQ